MLKYKTQIITSIIAIIFAIVGTMMTIEAREIATVIGVVMVILFFVAYVFITKKYQGMADILFNIWFFIFVFLAMFFGGFLLMDVVAPNCQMHDDGEYRCAMATAQLLGGLLTALIITPLSYWYYKKHRNHRIQIIWQMAMIVGMVIGGIIAFLQNGKLM